MGQKQIRLGRRQFTFALGAAGGLGAAGLLLGRSGHAAGKKAAYPGIQVGYAAITWGDQSSNGTGGARQAVAEISELGYPGIQLRAAITKEWKTPEELKADLAKAKLTFACLSGGGPSADPAKRDAEVERFVNLVKFAKGAGVQAVQATSPKRDEKVDKQAELISFSETLNAIGKATAALGVPLVFHPHMNQIGQDEADVALIMKKTDPKLVKLLLDTGHWAAAGGDPVKAVKEYGKRIVVLHVKDVTDKPELIPPPEPKKEPKKYAFVELGQGKVDFKGVFDALKANKFRGWAIVELDSVPAGRAPKEAAAANKAFLEGLGLAISPSA
jgi:inosose dehydratase